MALKPVVPIVDISALFSNERNSRAYCDAAERLGQACRKSGGVGITGHCLPSNLERQAFDVNKRLFSLPYEQKMKAPHPDGLYPHRGYSGPGKEALAGSAAVKTRDATLKEQLQTTLDHKETYEIGNDNNKENYNIWLPEDVLPGFKEFTTHFYWQLTEFTRVVLDALALGAGFDEEERKYTVDLHTGYDSAIRLLHYPSARVAKLAGAGRLGAHTDWALFTILFQDGVGGLEFQDVESGEYMPAIAQSGSTYLNVGDMLSRITNGLYPACMHRVTAASAQSAAQREAGVVPERHSIAYFVAPNPDAKIYAQPSRVTTDGHRRYEPVIFEEYSSNLFKSSQIGRDTALIY